MGITRSNGAKKIDKRGFPWHNGGAGAVIKGIGVLREGESVVSQSLEVTYYLHSGFSVASGRTLCVFDYWLGEHQELARIKRITPQYLARFDHIYVFISHSHPDHFDQEVYTWREDNPVTYIVSYEMPVGTRGKRMSPGDQLTLDEHVSVEAYDSTDLGVSFLVTLDGVRIFHAGDLSFWHWREESTVQEIEEAEQAFHEACEPLTKIPRMDVAFFPVDPRQGRLYDAGANYFIMAVKPRLLIPMHFWGRAEIAPEFARRARCRDTEVIAMTRPKERLLLEFADDGFMTIEIPTEADENAVSLGGYEGEDPFGDTDLPVDIR